MTADGHTDEGRKVVPVRKGMHQNLNKMVARALNSHEGNLCL
jgi:hypothetical protein